MSQRLSAHAERLAAIAHTKKALSKSNRCGVSRIVRAEREADIKTIEFAHRVIATMARAPDEFGALFLATAGAPL